MLEIADILLSENFDTYITVVASSLLTYLNKLDPKISSTQILSYV